VAVRVTFERVEQFVCDWFPDPEPETAYVRGFRAIVSLLLSAFVLGTVEPRKPSRFTGYHPAFIASVAWNMRNNNLWTTDGYDTSHWLSPAGDLAGGSYDSIPLEANACILGGRYESNPAQQFSVADEVRRWITEGRF
jgi:hypothetical protein